MRKMVVWERRSTKGYNERTQKKRQKKERSHLDQLATRNRKDSQTEETSPVILSNTRRSVPSKWPK